MTPLVLGIDIGTSSSKGVLATPGGEIVVSSEKVMSFRCPYLVGLNMMLNASGGTIFWLSAKISSSKPANLSRLYA